MSLPKITTSRIPSSAGRWTLRAPYIIQRYGFQVKNRDCNVLLWYDTGRLLSDDPHQFQETMYRLYGIKLDTSQAELMLHIEANRYVKSPLIQMRMQMHLLSPLTRSYARWSIRHKTDIARNNCHFSSKNVADVAAASLRKGLKEKNTTGELADTIEDANKYEKSPSSEVIDLESRNQPSSVWLPNQQNKGFDSASFAPRIIVVGVGGAGGNAVNNMIARGLQGVEFMVCNTDAQHLQTTLTENRVQMGPKLTGGLGCGANPELGREAAEAAINEILERIDGFNMVFVTAGMGGGTGTGAAPVIARVAMDAGILTVGVVTKPFRFEGSHRAKLAEAGLLELKQSVDSLIVIPNQNLFNVSTAQTSLMDAFRLADDVLLAGVKNISDLMVMPGLINLDFADVQSVMSTMGIAMMGSGEAEGENRALRAAEAALANPLLGDISVKDAKGMLVNITGGSDLTLFEVDEAAERVTREIEDSHANIIFGSSFDESLNGKLRTSIVATGMSDKDKK